MWHYIIFLILITSSLLAAGQNILKSTMTVTTDKTRLIEVVESNWSRKIFGQKIKEIEKEKSHKADNITKPTPKKRKEKQMKIRKAPKDKVKHEPVLYNEHSFDFPSDSIDEADTNKQITDSEENDMDSLYLSDKTPDVIIDDKVPDQDQYAKEHSDLSLPQTDSVKSKIKIHKKRLKSRRSRGGKRDHKANF